MWLSESGVKEPKQCVVEDKVKAAVRRKEVAWKEMLQASNEEAKERCMEVCR